MNISGYAAVQTRTMEDAGAWYRVRRTTKC